MAIQVAWGLQPPETALAAWGARAIYRNGHNTHYKPDIDFLPDRKEAKGEVPALRDLCWWLGSRGMSLLRERLEKGNVSPRDNVLVEIQEGKFTLQANPKASHGYLYIGAWC